MTPAQIGHARHALGLTRQQHSYRNHFVTGPGSKDFDDWVAMVDAGYARRVRAPHLAVSDEYFALTRAGAEAVLRPGETLSERDFPTAAA